MQTNTKSSIVKLAKSILLCGFLASVIHNACGQQNYEIQVYGSDTILKGQTMVELHSNFSAEGDKNPTDGTLPTDNAVRETLEVTHGFTPWFETGFYVFSSAHSGDGWQWVGDHIRPRVRVPEEWHWPVGLSLSAEVGYQRPSFSTDTWNFELRPIIDKKIGPLYLAFNPALEKSLQGPGSANGWGFSPAAKISLDVTKKVALGAEYYASFDRVDSWGKFGDQQHQLFPSIDIDIAPKWEFNFGVGFGLTHSSDHLIVKMILGRQF